MSPRRIRLDLEYDGTDFVGWQIQPEGRTVQGELRDALNRLLQQHVVPVGSGRTDAGVHALGQVAHFDTASTHEPERMMRALNSILPADIAVTAVGDVAADFHARYSPISKRYRYRISTSKSPLQRRQVWTLYRELDVGAMRDASQHLHGAHGFEAFCNHDPVPDSFLCEILHCQWCVAGADMTLEIEANRFLRHMVRIIVGTLVEVGRGKMAASAMADLLTEPTASTQSAHPARREDAGPTVPAQGLCLVYVRYPEESGSVRCD